MYYFYFYRFFKTGKKEREEKKQISFFCLLQFLFFCRFSLFHHRRRLLSPCCLPDRRRVDVISTDRPLCRVEFCSISSGGRGRGAFTPSFYIVCRIDSQQRKTRKRRIKITKSFLLYASGLKISRYCGKQSSENGVIIFRNYRNF